MGVAIAQRRLLLLALALLLSFSPAYGSDEDEISRLMRTTWERPAAPLAVGPVVVADGYAIAGWIQDDRGGRALLRKSNGAWEVILCSGDHLRSPETAQAAGVPADTAKRLVEALLAAEAGLPADRLGKLALFGETVRMDGASPQPHAK